MAKSKVKNIFQDYEPLWKYIRGEAKWAYVLEPDDYGNWSVNIYSDEIEELIPESQAGENSDIATMGAIIGFTLMMMLDIALVTLISGVCSAAVTFQITM